MTFGNDLIEVLGLGGSHRRKPEVIDDQEIGSQVFLKAFFPGLIGTTCQKEPEEFSGLGEEDFISEAAGLMSQSLGDMTLPHSRSAVEQNMLFLFDKRTVAKVSDQFGIELGVKGEVKAFEGLFFFEGGAGEPEVEFLRLSSFDFILDQEFQELHVSQGSALSLFEAKVQGLKESSEMEGFELHLELMFKIHGITSSVAAERSG